MGESTSLHKSGGIPVIRVDIYVAGDSDDCD